MERNKRSKLFINKYDPDHKMKMRASVLVKGKTDGEIITEKSQKVNFDSLPTNDLSKLGENLGSDESIVPKTIQLFLNLLNSLIEIERLHGKNLQNFFKMGLFEKKEKNGNSYSFTEENDYISLDSLDVQENNTLMRYQPHRNILTKGLFHLPSWDIFSKAIAHIGKKK